MANLKYLFKKNHELLVRLSDRHLAEGDLVSAEAYRVSADLLRRTLYDAGFRMTYTKTDLEIGEHINQERDEYDFALENAEEAVNA